MENTANERLSLFIEHLKKSRKIFNKGDFSEILNKPKSYISEISTGKRKVTAKFAQIIKTHFPELNIDWLLFGKGEMLKSSTPQPSTPQPSTLQPSSPLADELLQKLQSLSIEYGKALQTIEQLNEKIKELESATPQTKKRGTNEIARTHTPQKM